MLPGTKSIQLDQDRKVLNRTKKKAFCVVLWIDGENKVQIFLKEISLRNYLSVKWIIVFVCFFLAAKDQDIATLGASKNSRDEENKCINPNDDSRYPRTPTSYTFATCINKSENTDK